jgi:hypothetical protein
MTKHLLLLSSPAFIVFPAQAGIQVPLAIKILSASRLPRAGGDPGYLKKTHHFG